MKKFDQAECQHESTVFKDNRRHSDVSMSLLRIEAREGIKNIALKNFNNRHNGVRGGISARNIP